jgi:hypothetical protein
MKENAFMKSSMNADLKDFATPAAAFSQEYNQAPWAYVERQNSMVKAEASKLNKQSYKGRYSK